MYYTTILYTSQVYFRLSSYILKYMIAYLSGTVIEINDKDCTVLTNHIGYEVRLTSKTLLSLTKEETVSLFVYHHIKEDEQSLYGFRSKREKDVFKKLLSVNGVGPKAALSILGHMGPNELARSVEEGDSANISTSPGIGKKTAEKIIIELKGKLELDSDYENDPRLDVRLALEALGYSFREIQSTLEKLPKDQTDTSTLIRLALSQIK